MPLSSSDSKTRRYIECRLTAQQASRELIYSSTYDLENEVIRKIRDLNVLVQPGLIEQDNLYKDITSSCEINACCPYLSVETNHDKLCWYRLHTF